MKLVTTEQMRALEARTSAEAGLSIDDLIYNSGLAVAQEAWLAMGSLEGRQLLVLAGPGNNGADGLLAAVHLREMDAEAVVYLVGARPEDDPSLAQTRAAGIECVRADDDPGFERLEALLRDAACVIDALLGTGRSRPLAGQFAEVLTRLRAARERQRFLRVVAADVPSGVDADTGHADPLTPPANTTVCLGYVKVGMYQMPARVLGGEVIRADIGIPDVFASDLPYQEIDFRAAANAMPARPADAHKYTFGRAVIAAGSKRFPGAARLAAEAAARVGTGLVVIAAPEPIQAMLAYGLPEAVHEPLPDTDGALNGEAARALLRALPRATSLLVGPGLSHTPATEQFVRELLVGLDSVEGLRAVVLDADALNALAGQPGWHERLQLPRVLTPHAGEMARLLGMDAALVQADRVRLATRYAEETRSVVALKGACTIVAAPDGRARISGVANPVLATAGTGDVLAGYITGLIAQGVEPFDATSAAVYMQTEAASTLGREMGAATPIARDLFLPLPDIRKALDSG